MKGTIAIAVIVAFVAAIYGAPVAVSNVIDWIAVDDKVEEIRTVMKDGVSLVGNISNSDNPTIGLVIEAKLNASEKTAHAVLGKVKGQITAQTLTVAQARSSFQELQSILTDLEDGLRSDVAQLSPAAQAQIVETLNSSKILAEQKANEVYDLLAATSTIFVVDWIAVGDKVEEIRTVMKDGVSLVGNISNSDNPTIGLVIESKLNASEKTAHALLGKLKGQITAQTLTVAQARSSFQELQSILTDLEDGLRGDVAQLSPAAQAQIVETLNASKILAEQKANEVYDLLAVTILVVDWTAVDAKVEELRQVITNAVSVIRTTALADNPVVGSVIAQRLGVASGQANAVLGRAKQAIKDQTLTAEQASLLFDELQVLLSGLQDGLRDQVNQLSAAAQQQISATLTSSVDQAEQRAREVLDLLAVTILVVDWTAVDAKVEELRQVITNAVSVIRTTALADNPVVGSVIAQRLGVASGEANAVLGRAKQAIKDQTLTAEQASLLFDELQVILGGLQDGLRDQVNQLSAAAQQQISATLTSSVDQAEQRAREVLDLLRQ